MANKTNVAKARFLGLPLADVEAVARKRFLEASGSEPVKTRKKTEKTEKTEEKPESKAEAKTEAKAEEKAPTKPRARASAKTAEKATAEKGKGS